MKPKPLSRSLTFWSGILVISFVCLAWFSSYFFTSETGWDCFSMENSCGGVQMDSAYSRSGFRMGGEWKPALNDGRSLSVMTAPFVLRGTMGQASRGKSADPDSYRGAIESMLSRRDSRAWVIFIPHWIFLLAAALPWAGLLYWRSQRTREAVALGIEA